MSPAEQNELATSLLVGGVIWAYLGIIFEIVTETVAWERWEGTIEYTFMAPVSRPVHLIGMGVYAVLYGLVRAAAVFVAVVAFIGLHVSNANYPAAISLLAIASVSFIGVGMMTAVLPLISPEKGTQLGFVAQGLMLVVSGVYYPVSVLPEWMQWISKISPATYALRGCRASILEGAGLAWADVWPLLVIGVVLDPDGVAGLPRGRAVREAEREAEAVGMIRRAENEADLQVCVDVCNEVQPDEPVAIGLLERSGGTFLLHGEDGYAYVDRSSVPGSAFAMVRVRPGARRHGVGSALLLAARERAAQSGCAELWAASATTSRSASSRGGASAR